MTTDDNNRVLFSNKYIVILSEPKYEGNIGAVARVMKNFALRELVLINPLCSIGSSSDCYKYAMHAEDIIDNIKIYESLQPILQHYNIDLVVGTTGVVNLSERCFHRNPLPIDSFITVVRQFRGRTIGLLFGREDYGLSNLELQSCDLVVTIPTNPLYPILNISHAAGIIFYELYRNELDNSSDNKADKTVVKPLLQFPEHKVATYMERELLIEKFSQLLEIINYPEYKRTRARVLFRRLLGRAGLTEWEFHTFMGIVSRALTELQTNKIKKIKRKGSEQCYYDDDNNNTQM